MKKFILSVALILADVLKNEIKAQRKNGKIGSEN